MERVQRLKTWVETMASARTPPGVAYLIRLAATPSTSVQEVLIPITSYQ